jgi:acyl-CoA thioesterase
MNMNTTHSHLATPSQAAIDLAKQVGESMFAVDTASKDTMGMQLISCEPGRAVIQMTVKDMHLNGHKICHGGFIFTLADSTFAFACNSFIKVAVAAVWMI